MIEGDSVLPRFSVSLLFSAAVISGNQGDFALRRVDLDDVLFRADPPPDHERSAHRARRFRDAFLVQTALDQRAAVRAEPSDLPPFRFRSSESAQSFFLFLYDFSILFFCPLLFLFCCFRPKELQVLFECILNSGKELVKWFFAFFCRSEPTAIHVVPSFPGKPQDVPSVRKKRKKKFQFLVSCANFEFGKQRKRNPEPHCDIPRDSGFLKVSNKKTSLAYERQNNIIKRRAVP